MLALFVFLAIFYVSVVLLYLKTRTPKMTPNLPRHVLAEYISSQSDVSSMVILIAIRSEMMTRL